MQEWVTHTDLYEQSDDVLGEVIDVFRDFFDAYLLVAHRVDEKYGNLGGEGNAAYRIEKEFGKEYGKILVYQKDSYELDREYKWSIAGKEVIGGSSS